MLRGERVVTSQQAGILIICAGLGLAIIGVLVWAGALRWFGHLPGDVRIQGENVRVFFPIVSMIVLSVALSVIAHLVRRLL